MFYRKRGKGGCEAPDDIPVPHYVKHGAPMRLCISGAERKANKHVEA